MKLTKVEEKLIEDLGLKAQTRKLYEEIRKYCFYAKTDCFPSREKLAKKVPCSVRTVDRHLAILVKHNLIIKTRRGKMDTNLYSLPMKKIGQTVAKCEKKSKPNTSSSSSEVIGQTCSQNIYTKYIYDDYTPVQNIITASIETFGDVVIGRAMKLIQGKQITITGFYKYFMKVIETAKKQLTKEGNHQKLIDKYNKIKKSIKKKKNKPSTFTNYQQRQYNYELFEKYILGQPLPEGVELSDLHIGTYKPKGGTIDSTFSNHTQRKYNFAELEKRLLGWDEDTENLDSIYA